MKIVRAGCKTPYISICIPTLNIAQPSVAECLARIWCWTKAPFEVVIADCGGEVQGYTKPQTAAIDAASKLSWFIVAMNDDVLVNAGWLEELMLPMQIDPSIWCVTPDQEHADGPQVFAPYCMAWQRWAWIKLGGFDQQFEWWCSDIDIARRLEESQRLPVRVKLPFPIQHQIGATATGAHQEILNEMAKHDLDRYRQKWNCSAEEDKYRLRDLVWSPSQA